MTTADSTTPEPVMATTAATITPPGAITILPLPPANVDLNLLGLGNIVDVLRKLREIAKKFEGGFSLDLVGDSLKLVLALLGLEQESLEAALFIAQLSNTRNALRDENGSEIRLRRLLVDRFLPAGAGDVTLMAIPPGGPADNREPTWNPLPVPASLSRLAAELEGHLTDKSAAGVIRAADAAPGDPANVYDPKFLPPIVWQIGGAVLFEFIKRLIERRMARNQPGQE